MEEKKEDNLPPGFRFHPTDEELITYYLMNKISDSNFTGRAITDVDLNKSEPWELPGTLGLKVLAYVLSSDGFMLQERNSFHCCCDELFSLCHIHR